MSKAILISIKPQFVASILNLRKTIEIRKTAPKCDLPIDVYIYCTKSSCERLHKNKNGWFVNEMSTIFLDGVATEQEYNGKVVAKFTLREVEKCVNPMFPEGTFATPTTTYEDLLKKSCLKAEEINNYLGKGGRGYAWHISDLEIFDEPKTIWQMKFFSKSKKVRQIGHYYDMLESKQISKAQQSWCYVEVL